MMSKLFKVGAVALIVAALTGCGTIHMETSGTISVQSGATGNITELTETVICVVEGEGWICEPTKDGTRYKVTEVTEDE